MPIDRQVAVVTGAARGIGRGIAERLAKDGVAVALWDLNGDGVREVAEALVRDGHVAIGAQVDVTNFAQVQSAASDIERGWGRIDVLVNNAGWERYGWFLESDEADWDRVIGVNLRGMLVTCRVMGDRITKAQHGRIINIASDTAKLGTALLAVYSACKGGVISFTKAFAREVAPTGTTVNVVCPGATDTPLLHEDAKEVDTNPEFRQMWPDGIVETSIKNIPLGRLGQPSDIAAAIAFLIREDADFITGQVITVNGGLTMY